MDRIRRDCKWRSKSSRPMRTASRGSCASSRSDMRSEAVRILVVEDDEALGRALTRGLQDEGYLVDWADDAATALDHVRSRTYEVILLDRLLPGRRGEHVLADWR